MGTIATFSTNEALDSMSQAGLGIWNFGGSETSDVWVFFGSTIVAVFALVLVFKILKH